MLLCPCFKGGKWFVATTYVNDQNGESYPSINATRDGLSLLAMGLTGSKALGYIETFHATERSLPRQTPAVIPTKPKLSGSLVRDTQVARLR